MWKKKVSLELLNLLGEGSQGSVYKALRRDGQAGLTQVVAVKILHSQTTVDLWRLEFESLARVRSKYCVQVLSFERHLGRPALILEHVDGITLLELAQWVSLEDLAIQEIMAQIELGLKDLHDQGVFHGDLSPQNILVDRNGQIRLLDFGLANSSEEVLRLTPRFAAPERIQGGPSTAHSDLFSLGRIEEFLSGNSRDEYLNTKPEDRRFLNIDSSSAGVSALSSLVKQAIESKQAASLCRTKNCSPLQTSQLKKFKILRNSVAFLSAWTIFATSSAAPMKLATPDQTLCSIKTKQWHFLVLNGKPLGYAPVDLSLVSGGSYRLEWVSARGRGSLDIHPDTNQSVVLTDSDFSH